MRHANPWTSFAGLLAVTLSLSVPCQAQQPKYKLTDLGTLLAGYSQAFGINNAGQVVGISDAVGGVHSFRTASNRAINPGTDDLGTLGGRYSYARAINASGQVVGFSQAANGNEHAFRTGPLASINPATDDLGSLGGVTVEALGVNASGQAIGVSRITEDSPAHGFRTGPGLPINPATDNLDSSGMNSAPWGINDAGQVVGNVNGYGFRTAPNALINLATDALGGLGGSGSTGTAINRWGQVVGFSLAAGGQIHAFRTGPNAPINPATDDLGTLGGQDSYAYGVNASGQVVGASYTGQGTSHAFFVDVSGAMQDLNDLIPPGSGWVLGEAYGINDLGQIAATAIGPSSTHAVRLDPSTLQPLYSICLLYDPTKAVNSGSTIPIKLHLCDSSGNYLSSTNIIVHAISVTKVSNSISGSVQDSGNANPDDDFRFAGLGGSGGYIFNLSTKGLTTGTYNVNFDVTGDPTVYAVPFQVK